MPRSYCPLEPLTGTDSHRVRSVHLPCSRPIIATPLTEFPLQGFAICPRGVLFGFTAEPFVLSLQVAKVEHGWRKVPVSVMHLARWHAHFVIAALV